ncbi:MAG: exonuclease domain-containing protein, partial [Myxococcota bacterium]
ALLEAMTGRALLVHHAPLDTSFLDRACRVAFGGPLMPHVVDTAALARARLERSGLPMPAGTYRLGALRQRYGLPRYRAHDALTDALATAELYLAMTSGQGDARLRDVLCG